MITRPTVLVLGAGASAPYGFPTGRALLDDIVRQTSTTTTTLARQLLELGHNDAEVEEFSTVLRQAGRQSVDAVLEHRPEFLAIGKAATAALLVPCERSEVLFEPSRQGAWYEYLWNRLNCPIDTFAQNRLSIVTFNYDRSVEFYLYTVLKNAYGLDDDIARIALSRLPIVHLHGRLGDLFTTTPLLRRYGEPLNAHTLRGAADSIQVVHEDLSKYPQFAEARMLINAAERIYFLGFGYDPTNVQRLGITDTPAGKTYMGTTFGLTEMEASGIAQRFGRQLEFRAHGAAVLDFLRNAPALDA